MTATASPPQPRTTIRPVRVYDWNEDLKATVARVYGYRAECRCDWRGPIRREFDDARRDARWHECGGNG